MPFESEGGTFVVPVSINDTISLKFTIDSGAADVAIPADVARTLMRSGTITSSDYIGDKTFVLANGETVPSAEFRIHTLRIGTLVLHDVTGSLADPNGSLLLGQSFLSRLSSWSVDNGRRVLILKAAGPGVEVAASPPVVPSTDPTGDAPPAHVASDNAAPTVGMEIAAAQKAVGYLAAWSNPQDPNVSGIRQYYAALVNFYGANATVDSVMLQKTQFAVAWPSRSYVARPASIVAQCTDEHTCTVRGVLDWRAANQTTGRRSAGVATFMMELKDGLIDGESGSVLSRE